MKWIRRSIGLIYFLWVFLKAFVVANLSVAYTVLFVRKTEIHPAFFEYGIEDLTWIESLILSYCITLTPGTITVKMLQEQKKMVLHTIDFREPEKVLRVIDHEFKPSILRFTR